MNTQINNLYFVILAGGTGRRLWPVSRKALPKQFLDIFGTGETMLQQAANRAAKLAGEDHVMVVTSIKYADIVTEQLPWLPPSHVLAEPVHRNTAPASAWAVHRIMVESNDDTTVVLMPSDQMILHEDRFAEAIVNGQQLVMTTDTVLTMGATPTRTEPGYGYIQKAQTPSVTDVTAPPIWGAAAHGGVAGSAKHDSEAYEVKSFVEKPEREFAKMLIESGEFLWNTGIYMARTGYFLEQMKLLLPTVLRNERSEAMEEREFITANYARYPNLSLDMAILEKMQNRSVMHCDFGWADIGTWHGIYEAIPNNAEENVVVNANSRVIADGSQHNVIALPKGKLAIVNGLDGYIVAEKDDVLLICPKSDSSAMIRKYLTIVENDESLADFT